ncbi:hypothetical protein L7F22_057631 [Adiantum nelumboides]|nr:hypothetical protein [Adiantum nelumboides]
MSSRLLIAKHTLLIVDVMAAQAALHAACFPATAKFKAASKASILSESMSFLQSCSASNVFKELRLTCPPQSTLVTKVTGVAFARTAGQMDRSVSIQFNDEATFTSEPFEEKQLKVNVNLTSVGTRRAFDFVLENMRKTAPPVPGFRRAKGGKTCIVPCLWCLDACRLSKELYWYKILRLSCAYLVQGVLVSVTLKIVMLCLMFKLPFIFLPS